LEIEVAVAVFPAQAMLTMGKCDIAFSEDADAMLAASSKLGAPPVDGLMHAGGVLKVISVHFSGV
jgi:hypothetical protein